MSIKDFPEHYLDVKKKFRSLYNAVGNLGKVTRNLGPLDEKTSHLIKLAASAAIHSEGAVHSHTRRALAAGAKPEEIYHTIILLTNTIGFPTVAAALSWADDVIQRKKD
ncbi:MAG: carboxymuconolactone decarboxylase family protein [Nitrospirota bacterium]